MSFPVDPLVGKIEFAFGADLKANPATWVYTDRTVDWLAAQDLAATIGRADATGKAQPGKLNFWLKNPGGRYTKGNPLSPHWPYIRKNTPVRVTLNPGTGRTRVYQMYVTQWIPKWGSAGDSGKQPLVQVVANGIRRRLTQGARPLRSALYRKVAAGTALAAWSLEDGSTATTGAPTKAGTDTLIPFGSVPEDIGSITPLFGKIDGPPGSAQLPDFSAKGALQGAVPAYADTGQWQVEVWFRTDIGDSSKFTACVPIQVDLIGGTYPAMDVLVFIGQGAGGDGLGTIGFDISPYMASPPTEIYRAGTSGIAPDGPYLILSKIPSVQGAWRQLRVCMRQVGANVELSAYLDNVRIGINTAGPATLGRLGRFVMNATQGVGAYAGVAGTGISSLGHVSVYNTITDPGTYQAGLGYAGETVAARLARLGGEEGIPITVSSAATTRMGPQLPAPFMDLADECADADGGILLDGLSAGFNYLPRADAYNLPVAVTIDMSSRQFKAPFEPLDDDANIVNDETVSRVDGSSAQYVDATGPAGTDAIGRYDDTQTLNVYSDADLLNQAAWRAHLGTAGAVALRFPGVGFDLHTKDGQALIEPWLQAGVRKRIQVVNPPAEYGAQDAIDLLVEGYTETVNSRRTWSVQANASPYVHNVAVVGQTRVDSAGTTVRATVPAGSSSLQVNVVGPRWTTNAAFFPLYLDIDGIRVRVTGITGTTSPQTLTVDPATVTKQLTAGRKVHLWRPDVVAL